MSDRGVSDVLGFVLVFALITGTVGVVYVSGIGGLTDARDAEQVNNAERAFDVLADNFADIHRRDAPSRATEIKLADATVGFAGATTMEVEIAGTGRPADAVELRPVVYTAASGAELVYEAGAVVRTDPGGGAVMLREPDMVFRIVDGDPVAVVPLVQTRRAGSGGVGGSTTVLVRGDLAISEVLTARTSGGYTVTYTVETTPSRAPAWLRYLESELDGAAWNSNCGLTGADGATVECSFDADRVYVTATRIDVTVS